MGSARSIFIKNLPSTIITMKLTTKSSWDIFKKVPEFLQRSTDRLDLDSGGSLPTISWMIWHHTWFRSLFSLFRVTSGVGDYGVVCLYVFWFFYDFRTCRVGHLICAYLKPHISNFSSKFCNIDCLTLHLPQGVICRPRQTRVDVHVLVVIIQGLFQQYVISGTRTKNVAQKEIIAQKHVTAQKHKFLPA